MKHEYEMSEADLLVILNACKPVRYMVAGGRVPRSPQENANDAWAGLGQKLGFDSTTVQPVSGKNDRFFTAKAAPRVYMDGDQHCAVMPDFINLQESPAGFGASPEAALVDLTAAIARAGA